MIAVLELVDDDGKVFAIERVDFQGLVVIAL